MRNANLRLAVPLHAALYMGGTISSVAGIEAIRIANFGEKLLCLLWVIHGFSRLRGKWIRLPAKDQRLVDRLEIKRETQPATHGHRSARDLLAAARRARAGKGRPPVVAAACQGLARPEALFTYVSPPSARSRIMSWPAPSTAWCAESRGAAAGNVIIAHENTMRMERSFYRLPAETRCCPSWIQCRAPRSRSVS